MVLLKDERPYTRKLAADALGSIGPEASEAVPSLAKALFNKDVVVRISAAQALGKMGKRARSAVPALEKARQDSITGRDAEAALKKVRGDAP